MNDDEFFARNAQIRRELLRLWRRMDPLTLLLVTIATLASFYGFRSLGRNPAYTVILPHIVVTLHLVLLAMMQTREEYQSAFSAIYRSLPRDFSIAYDARALFYLGLALYYELVILIGTLLKFGGDGITTSYYFLASTTVLPLASVFYTLWYAHHQRPWWFGFSLYLLFLVTLLRTPLIFDFNAPYQPSEDPFPPRLLPLTTDLFLATVLLAGGILLYARVRNKQIELIGSEQ